MSQSKSNGFIDIVILFVGIISFISINILRVGFSSQVIKSHYEEPTISSVPLRFDRAQGIQLTDSFQIEVLLNGSRTLIPLLGTDTTASQSADCISKDVINIVTTKISGKALYMIYYENTLRTKTTYPRYIFLEDGSSLNSYLIAQGVAYASSDTHPYRDDFVRAQQHAQDEKQGFWSTDCTEKNVSPTPTTTTAPTAQPTRSPTSSQILFYTTPTATPPVNLNPYIISTSSATLKASSLNRDLIFTMINDYRVSKRLKTFTQDSQLCSLAQARAPELYDEIFVTGNVHEGFYSRSIPYWITENMASYPTEALIVQWWLNSPIHRAAIEGDYLYSCGACSGTSCTQLFTSFIPK